MIRFIAASMLSCAGWVGDSGFICPEIPEEIIGLDEPLPGFDSTVEDLPMFASSPARVSLDYADGRSTGLSMRLEPVQAMVRSARDPIHDPPAERQCEEVLATYLVELFSDDGTFEWQGGGEVVIDNADAAAQLTLAVPYVANLGDAQSTVDRFTAELLAEHASLAPESLRPVGYRLDLDLSDRAPRGTLTLVVTHDPVPSTVTEWVIGTF